MPDLEAASVIVQHRERIAEVLKVFAKYGLASLADGDPADPARFSRIRDLAASHVDPQIAQLTPGARLCAALGELGTAWIKLGQTLSTRPDLVGPSIADELSQLQSAAPPDARGDALATVERELGAPVRELYGSFYRPVTASASIAEVHKATLEDHTRVVVKVVHHGAAQRVRDDLAIMRVLAVRLQEQDEDIALYRPAAIVDDFAAMLEEALDLRNEAKNLELFRTNFADDDDLLIPQPYPELSSASVLTMTREEGRTMTDRRSLERAGWDVDALVEKAADVYLKMIFRDGIFHADPHPGNFMLTRDHKLAIIDFGDIGRVTPTRRDQLARMALALVTRDDATFVDGIIEFSDVPPGTDLAAARRDLTDWVDVSLAGGVGRLDAAAAATSYAEIMRTHRFVMPSDMALLLRTLVRLQGLAQKLEADVDLVSLIEPYAIEIARDRFSPARLLASGARTVRRWSQLIGSLPDDVSAALAQLREGRIAIEFRVRDDDRITDRVVGGLVTASSLLAASQLASRRTPPTLKGLSLPAILALAIGVSSWYRNRTVEAKPQSLVSIAADVIRRARPR